MRVPTLMLLAGLSFPMVLAAQVTDPIAAAQLRKAEAEANTAASNAETAASNAEKAKWEAATAAERSKYGPLGSKAVDGSVEVAQGAGKFEATFLGSKSIDALAKEIVDDLNGIPANSRVLIVTGTEIPSFEGYDAFVLRVEQLDLEFDKAMATSRVAKPKKPKGGRGASTVGASTSGAAVALDVIGNLFRADYKVAALDFTLDDQLLVRAIIHRAHGTWDIRVPTYAPSELGTTNPAVEQLNEVLADRRTAAGKLIEAKAEAEKFKDYDYAARIAALEAYVKSAEGFIAEMRTAVAGVVPFLVIAKQAQLRSLLDGGHLLMVKVHVAGGSSVAKKNFWTFLGAMPFKVSGGALVSYSVFDGSSGRVVGGGLFQDLQPLTPLTRVSNDD
jgi:hypothetical protein